jgi:hypothetical protein
MKQKAGYKSATRQTAHHPGRKTRFDSRDTTSDHTNTLARYERKISKKPNRPTANATEPHTAQRIYATSITGPCGISTAATLDNSSALTETTLIIK